MLTKPITQVVPGVSRSNFRPAKKFAVQCHSQNESQAQEPRQQSPLQPRSVPRRNLVLLSGAAPALALLTGLSGTAAAEEAVAGAAPEAPQAPAASSSELIEFENTTDSYTLLVPSGWEKGEGSVGTRKLVAFHPPTTTAANVSVLITPLGADFTSLGSFGTADAFAESLVNGLDRSYLRKPGQRAELIAAKSARNMYFVEYTVQKPGEQKVHLLSAVAIHFNGIYNQLYTLTAQYVEDDAELYESTIRKVFDSFNLRR